MALVYSTVTINMQYAQVCVLGIEMLFLSVLVMFSAPMKERLASTNTDKVLCPTRVQPHVTSPCWLEKWFFYWAQIIQASLWENASFASAGTVLCLLMVLHLVRKRQLMMEREAPDVPREGTEKGWWSELGLTAASFHFSFFVVSWRDFCLLDAFKLDFRWVRLKAGGSKQISVCLLKYW